jgi:hypothetical protein
MGAPWPTAAPEADDDPEGRHDQRHRPDAELKSAAVKKGAADFDEGDHDLSMAQLHPRHHESRGDRRLDPCPSASCTRAPSAFTVRVSRKWIRLERVRAWHVESAKLLVSRRLPRVVATRLLTAGVW